MVSFPLKRKNSYIYRSLAPVAISQVLNSLEIITNRKIYQKNNYLRGTTSDRLKNSRFHSATILKKISHAIDSPRTVDCCTVVNLCGCSIILLKKDSRYWQALGALLILGNNKLIAFRNPYGRDGADQMGALILSYRLATALIPDKEKSDDLFLRAVNFQTCLSYLVPGVAKAVSYTWLKGNALEEILHTKAYGSSPVAVRLKRHPELMKYLTWGTIIWESSFPIIYFIPQKFVNPILTTVKFFHFGVALTMGLPRFFWGFAGAHVSIEYVMKEKNEHK